MIQTIGRAARNVEGRVLLYGDKVTPSMAAAIERYIEAVTQALGTGDESEAMFAVSAMVGALALSRAMTDPARSDALLRATRERLSAPSA